MLGRWVAGWLAQSIFSVYSSYPYLLLGNLGTFFKIIMLGRYVAGSKYFSIQIGLLVFPAPCLFTHSFFQKTIKIHFFMNIKIIIFFQFKLSYYSNRLLVTHYFLHLPIFLISYPLLLSSVNHYPYPCLVAHSFLTHCLIHI